MIRSTVEIREELRGVKETLDGPPRIVDPWLRAALGRRRRELKDELAEAERRLREGE